MAKDNSTRSTPTGEVEADQVKHMVDRFLSWRLPESFNPDGGISFERDYNQSTPWPAKHEPTGTNLFDAQQAEAMVRYMLEGTALVTSVFPSEQTDVSAMPSHTAADAVHAVFSDMLHGRIPTPSAAQLIQVLGPEPFHAALSAPKPVVEGYVMVPRADLEALSKQTTTDHLGDEWATTAAQWAKQYLASAPQPPATGSYQPQIIHYEGEGDPYSEFVERDTPTITGQVYAANVDMDDHTTRMERAIERLKELQTLGDTEIAHKEADRVLRDMLLSLGCTHLVAEWEKVVNNRPTVMDVPKRLDEALLGFKLF